MHSLVKLPASIAVISGLLAATPLARADWLTLPDREGMANIVAVGTDDTFGVTRALSVNCDAEHANITYVSDFTGSEEDEFSANFTLSFRDVSPSLALRMSSSIESSGLISFTADLPSKSLAALKEGTIKQRAAHINIAVAELDMSAQFTVLARGALIAGLLLNDKCQR